MELLYEAKYNKTSDDWRIYCKDNYLFSCDIKNSAERAIAELDKRDARIEELEKKLQGKGGD